MYPIPDRDSGGTRQAWFECLQTGIVVTVLLFPAAAAPLRAAGDERTPSRVVPWLEVNAPTSRVDRWFPEAKRSRADLMMRDFAVEGLAIWGVIADTAIVTSRPEQVHSLYPHLMRHKPPHMRIVGGIKTFHLPGGMPSDKRTYDFADRAGWRKIAQQSQEIVRITGTNIVVLDNETTLGPFTRGQVTIDFDRLEASLAALRDSGIVYWWNLPRVLPNSVAFPDRSAQTERLVRTIARALPTCVFLSGYTAWHDDSPEAAQHTTMIACVGKSRLQPRLLVTPDGRMHYPGGRNKRCFTPTEGVARARALEREEGEFVNVYTGGEDWVAVAEAFVKAWTAP